MPATPISAPQVAEHLRQLYAERELARLEGLARDRGYMDDLEQEIDASRHAYVGAAVTEIAVLRADLSGPLLG